LQSWQAEGLAGRGAIVAKKFQWYDYFILCRQKYFPMAKLEPQRPPDRPCPLRWRRMKNNTAIYRVPKPTLADRFELWFSTGKQSDGLWIGVSLDSEADPILRRVEEALHLIKAYDRFRYDRLTRDLERVWVRLLPGVFGNFNSSLRACELDRRFVLSETSTEVIAATIVHEATHARIHRCGIGYDEKLRPRIEAACLRRELAFAAKLPNGEKVRDYAERSLSLCATQDFWTNAAFGERHDKDHIQALRDLGVSDRLIRTILIVRRLRLRMTRLAKGILRMIKGRYG
jgi:hypothetical protein